MDNLQKEMDKLHNAFAGRREIALTAGLSRCVSRLNGIMDSARKRSVWKSMDKLYCRTKNRGVLAESPAG